MIPGPSVKLAASPDIGEGGLTLYLTVTSGERDWSYSGFATSEGLAKFGDPSNLEAIFESKRLFFCGKALELWKAQPESAKYMITADNAEAGGGFVNNG